MLLQTENLRWQQNQSKLCTTIQKGQTTPVIIKPFFLKGGLLMSIPTSKNRQKYPLQKAVKADFWREDMDLCAGFLPVETRKTR